MNKNSVYSIVESNWFQQKFTRGLQGRKLKTHKIDLLLKIINAFRMNETWSFQQKLINIV